MNIIFTVCSNNYLAQAAILASSVKKHEPQAHFVLILCDIERDEIAYSDIDAEIITIASIESKIEELAKKFNIIELNTAVKPRAIEYFFKDRGAETVIYLDPDTRLYAPLSELYKDLKESFVLLTPHIYTPIPIDGKKPGENTFLNYGIYNLGFIALKRSPVAGSLVSWWKNHTYEAGFFRPQDGLFVDQLPMNHAPIFFDGVKIIQNRGMNMAPWNLHERELSLVDNQFWVNKTDKLVFFHFSSFHVDANELPLNHYDRYTMAQRPDLKPLYDDYNREMMRCKYSFYCAFESYYSTVRKAHLEACKRHKRLQKYSLKKLLKFKK